MRPCAFFFFFFFPNWLTPQTEYLLLSHPYHHSRRGWRRGEAWSFPAGAGLSSSACAGEAARPRSCSESLGVPFAAGPCCCGQGRQENSRTSPVTSLLRARAVGRCERAELGGMGSVGPVGCEKGCLPFSLMGFVGRGGVGWPLLLRAHKRCPERGPFVRVKVSVCKSICSGGC